MKKLLFFVFTIFSYSISFAQVGINTKTPQKTLHVNGTMLLTNELNVGGNDITNGSPGNNGQFLLSQGVGFPPKWTSVNIPILDENSYKLKSVYIFDLFDPFTITNSSYLALGEFNSIKIDSPNNLLVVDIQSSTSAISLSTGEGMSYRYRLSGNNSFTTILSPYFYLLYSGFNPMNNITSYRFFSANLTPNSYNLNLEAARTNTSGTNTASKFIHFNRTYSTSTSYINDGKAIIYVYEK